MKRMSCSSRGDSSNQKEEMVRLNKSIEVWSLLLLLLQGKCFPSFRNLTDIQCATRRMVDATQGSTQPFADPRHGDILSHLTILLLLSADIECISTPSQIQASYHDAAEDCQGRRKNVSMARSSITELWNIVKWTQKQGTGYWTE
jgi:hypothetical protein